MMPSSRPPPPTHGNGPFVVAAVLMLCGAAGLIYWQLSRTAAPAEPAPAPSIATKPELPALEAPPPPPPPEEPKEEAAKEEVKSSQSRAAGATAGDCGPVCEGNPPASLESALHATARQSQTCYERALRQNAQLEGRMLVAVRVSPSGGICSARTAQNSIADQSVTACVLQKFRGAQLPKPVGGCVDVQVPIQFKPKVQ